MFAIDEKMKLHQTEDPTLPLESADLLVIGNMDSKVDSMLMNLLWLNSLLLLIYTVDCTENERLASDSR